MNMMTSPSKIRIPEAELQALGQQAFEALGLPNADARDVVQVLLLADLFGLSTHGLSRVESYGERLDVAGMKQLLLKLDFLQRILRGETAVAEE